MTSQSGYHSWRFRAEAPDRHIVFPDGCRDVLLIRGPDDGSDGGDLALPLVGGAMALGLAATGALVWRARTRSAGGEEDPGAPPESR